MAVLYEPGYYFAKSCGVVLGFLRRLRTLVNLRNYDYILIHRECAPLGPPVLEAIIFHLHKRVIFDFDDAIFINNTSRINRFVAFAKWPSKTRYLCRKSWKVTACNPYLVQWAKQFNRNVVLLPTTIDLNYHRPISKAPLPGRRTIIGWTGSRSTVRYLELIRPVLKALQLRRDFEFRVICDVDPDFSELVNYRFVPWRKETEISDLSAFDIGLMPVPQGDWELGKVGFKAIQYSGVEAVPVVSSTGSGHEVVIDGETGFVVDNTHDAWIDALCKLIDKPELISHMGSRARTYIDMRFSVRSQEGTYLSLFSDLQ